MLISVHHLCALLHCYQCYYDRWKCTWMSYCSQICLINFCSHPCEDWVGQCSPIRLQLFEATCSSKAVLEISLQKQKMNSCNLSLPILTAGLIMSHSLLLAITPLHSGNGATLVFRLRIISNKKFILWINETRQPVWHSWLGLNWLSFFKWILNHNFNTFGWKLTSSVFNDLFENTLSFFSKMLFSFFLSTFSKYGLLLFATFVCTKMRWYWKTNQFLTVKLLKIIV